MSEIGSESIWIQECAGEKYTYLTGVRSSFQAIQQQKVSLNYPHPGIEPMVEMISALSEMKNGNHLILTE